MAPLPANQTARVWVGYNDGHNDHELMVRYDEAVATSGQALAGVHALLTELDSILFTLTITGARGSLFGQDFSVPLAWSHDASYGSVTMPVLQAPREMRFVGRSSADGRKVGWSIYGFNGTTPDSYRIPDSASAVIEAAIDTIQGATTNSTFLTISGTTPLLYRYVNIQNNSYYESKARG